MSSTSRDIKNDTDAAATAFGRLYTQLRSKEQRVYTDAEVVKLPKIGAGHPHFKEWLVRQRSCKRLIKHLNKKNKPLDILEIGCGNGWLSAQLAKNTSGQVVGMDINAEELAQASRVFSDTTNLRFIPGDIRVVQPDHSSFDVIVFAASIQYFSSLAEILQPAFQGLRAGGEIHIIDSIFYKKNDVAAARQRTKHYYTNLGFPEAADYYYHHCIEDLEKFSFEILYDPRSWKHRFKKNKSPFFWVCLKKPGHEESNS